MDKIIDTNSDEVSPEHLVDKCLDQMGALAVSDKTRTVLLSLAEQDCESRETVAQMLRLTAASEEFQRA